MRFLRRRPRRRASSPDPTTVRALLDFGAGGARAVLARILPDYVEILGSAEVTGRSGMARPGQVMRRDQIASLAERALSAAEWSSAREGELPYIADDAVVGLTGPLLSAQSEVYHTRRDDRMAPVYERELRAVLHSAQRRNLQALSEQAATSRIRRTLVSSQLVGAVSVRADTREAARLPEVTRGIPGLAGDYLSIAICNLTWPSKGLEMLGRVLDDLELNLLDVTPIAQAVAAALPLPDAVLLDIGQEHTEVSLVEGGNLSALASIPQGGHFFTQSLTRYLRLSEKHAELIKQQFTTARTRPGPNPISRILNNAVATWHRSVEQTLLHLAGEASLPPRIYLFGGGAQLPLVLEHLRATQWMRRLPFERYPEVERLFPYQLQGLNDPRGMLASPAQTGLAALAIWAGREEPPLQQCLAAVTSDLAPAFHLV